MLRRIFNFIRTTWQKIKPRHKRKIRVRERDFPGLYTINIGAPIERIRKSVKLDFRVPDDKPVTIPVGHIDREIRFAATVDRIRFKGNPFDIFVVFSHECNIIFGSNTYRAGEVIYYNRNDDSVIFREVFMICADTVTIRPPQFAGTSAEQSPAIRIGDLVMYEPCSYGRPWVDLMWGRDICSLEAVENHFRNPRITYGPTEEEIFQERCSKFYRLCHATVAGIIPVVL